MTQAEIEQRLLALEAEIQSLKKQQGTPNKADPKWVLAHAGRFANDPGFDEVIRLGRQYRKSLDRKPRKKTATPKAKLSGLSFSAGKYLTKKKTNVIQKPKLTAKYGGS
jgi:hypothetical protein